MLVTAWTIFASQFCQLFVSDIVTNIDPATVIPWNSEMKVESKTEANDEENIPVVICGVSFQDWLPKADWSN